MGFNLQRITQIMMQEFSTVNLLHLVKGHWKNNKPGIGLSKDKFFGFMKVNDHIWFCAAQRLMLSNSSTRSVSESDMALINSCHQHT